MFKEDLEYCLAYFNAAFTFEQRYETSIMFVLVGKYKYTCDLEYHAEEILKRKDTLLYVYTHLLKDQ